MRGLLRGQPGVGMVGVLALAINENAAHARINPFEIAKLVFDKNRGHQGVDHRGFWVDGLRGVAAGGRHRLKRHAQIQEVLMSIGLKLAGHGGDADQAVTGSGQHLRAQNGSGHFRHRAPAVFGELRAHCCLLLGAEGEVEFVVKMMENARRARQANAEGFFAASGENGIVVQQNAIGVTGDKGLELLRSGVAHGEWAVGFDGKALRTIVVVFPFAGNTQEGLCSGVAFWLERGRDPGRRIASKRVEGARGVKIRPMPAFPATGGFLHALRAVLSQNGLEALDGLGVHIRRQHHR